jgi:hypothetical protein
VGVLKNNNNGEHTNHPRIYIGPQEIAGYYANLTYGLRTIGVPCDYITYVPHQAGYGGESKRPILLKAADVFNRRRGRPNLSILLRIILAIPSEILTAMWALSAVLRYDIFIFGFGRSLLRWNLDLYLLKWLRKTVISNLSHGSEARPPFIDGSYQSFSGEQPSIDLLKKRTKEVAKTVRRHENLATMVIGSPFSTSQFAIKPFLNHFSIGLPASLNRGLLNCSLNGVENNNITNRRVKILHCPSHPAVKGSLIIQKAIQELKDEGFDIDFQMLHGKKHIEVIAAIQECDFVVDQIYCDTPMAGFACEAACYGRAAVVGGYQLEKLKQFVPPGMWPPSYLCAPDCIKDAIKRLIQDREIAKQVGIDAYAFVQKKWNAALVAEKYLTIIKGVIPSEWWIQPSSIVYLEGIGQSRQITKKNVSELISKHGIDSLHLSHKKNLETAFTIFASFS